LEIVYVFNAVLGAVLVMIVW